MAFGHGASAVVAHTFDRRFGIKAKAQGQNGTVRTYPLPAVDVRHMRS
jgi:hypothetical protein